MKLSFCAALGWVALLGCTSGTAPDAAQPVLPTADTTANVGEFKTSVPVLDMNVIAVQPTSNSVLLTIYSAKTRSATVSMTGVSNKTVPLTAGATSNVELTGLAADRYYGYQVTTSGVSISGRIHTTRAAGATYRFIVQADSHLDTNTDPKVYTAALNDMKADSADFLVDLGDTFMSDKYPDFHDASAQYYAQRYYFGLTGASLPLFLVQGNHDGELGWLADNAAWARTMRAQYFAGSTSNYYAWSWGDATFIVLDPYTYTTTKPTDATSWNWTLGRQQYDWLAATLTQKTTRYTFVFIHQLVGGNGKEARGGAEASRNFEWGGSSDFVSRRPGWPMPIHDLLMLHHVNAVFHGHDHFYAHQERDGIAYQLVPQPGSAREGAPASATDYGYLEGTILGSPGYLRVTVSPNRAMVEFIRVRLASGNGSVVDSYELR